MEREPRVLLPIARQLNAGEGPTNQEAAMRRILGAVAVGMTFMTASPVHAQGASVVDQEVRAVAAELRRSWDTRDIDGWMACFGNPEGLVIGGGVSYTLESLREANLRIWANRTSESWTNDRVQVIALDDTTALLQITYSGRYTLQSGVTWEFKASSFSTSLVRKTGNAWKIVAHHNSGSGTQVPK